MSGLLYTVGFAIFFSTLFPSQSFAQEEELVFDIDEDEENTEETTDSEKTDSAKTEKTSGADSFTNVWEHVPIVASYDLKDRPFYKGGRLELLPLWGININDHLIRQMSVDMQINYHFSDSWGIGLEGRYYFQTQELDNYLLLARRHGYQSSRNKSDYGGSLNLHYTPFRGKFALFNRIILYWNTALSLGFSAEQSRIIPRNIAHQDGASLVYGANANLSFRLVLAKWAVLFVGVRDILLFDQFESINRQTPNVVETVSGIRNSITFQAGLGFWLP